MHRSIPLMSSVWLLAFAQPVWADSPPADAQPLSQIIQTLEQQRGVAYFDEVEWDDDDGHWEIEYVTADGGTVEIQVDPVTGEVSGD